MRLAGRVAKLEEKIGAEQGQHTSSAIIGVDSRYPKDKFKQFIAEHGFEAPGCLLIVLSFVTTNNADLITEPYVIHGIEPV